MEREEAIQVVRGLTETTYFDDRELEGLRTLIPELTESEDERIRKMCITAVNIAASTDGGLLHHEASECLAWLEEQKDKNCLACDQHLKGYLAGRKVTEEEKQKENPKSADSIPSDCVSDVKCEDRSPKHTDSFGTDIRDTPAYWRGWDDAMKQKEQEHPNGCFTCDEYKKGYEAGRFHGFTAGYNKAKAEQKSAEWSEEDEKMKEKLITRLNWITYNTRTDGTSPNITFFDEIEWLKSLPLNLKKKNEDVAKLCSNEWSEEAKEAKETIIAALTVANMTTDCKRRAKKWLQSLRPSWKPSEEQMDWLRLQVAAVLDKPELYKIVEPLYNNLRKLM